MKDKPTILISGCLLGRICRYDGACKKSDVISNTLASLVKWLPVCPESDSGMPTPRPPMSIYRQPDGSFKLLTREKQISKTSQLQTWIAKTLPLLGHVSGAILKSKSPSCGFGTTPVIGDDNLGSGLFAAALHQAYPALLIMDETQLDTPEKCLEFLGKCCT